MLVHIPLFLALLGLLSAPCSSDVCASDLAFGGELRLRAEGFDNALDLEDTGADSTAPPRNDAYEYLRLRSRIWMKASPHAWLTMFFRLGNEFRFGRGPNASGVKDADSKMSLDDGWAQIALGRTSLAFGRMDLQYGEGFLLFDGTPADGSSSSWFDAVKLSIVRPMGHVDLLFAQIDEEGFGGAGRDEACFGVYGVRGAMETYVLRRTKGQSTTTLSGTVHPRGNTTAIGARVSRSPVSGITYAVEGAYQRGIADGADREGYGGYCRLAWRGGGAVSPGVELGAVYLTGDDPETDGYEGWDGFYAEWPKYSDLLVYTLYDNTTRITPNEPGTWTNLVGGWVELGAAIPHGRLAIRCTPLGAAVADNGPGSGSRRGLLLAARADLDLGDGVQSQLLGEYFDPGDFYASSADLALYGRWQLTARF